MEGSGKLGFPRAEITLMKFMESVYPARALLTCVLTVVGMGGGVIQKRLLWKTEAD